MSEIQEKYGDTIYDFDYVHEIEKLLFHYWLKLPEPKVGYSQWMYPYRKSAVMKLFTKEVMNE